MPGKRDQSLGYEILDMNMIKVYLCNSCSLTLSQWRGATVLQAPRVDPLQLATLRTETDTFPGYEYEKRKVAVDHS